MLTMMLNDTPASVKDWGTSPLTFLTDEGLIAYGVATRGAAHEAARLLTRLHELERLAVAGRCPRLDLVHAALFDDCEGGSLEHELLMRADQAFERIACLQADECTVTH